MKHLLLALMLMLGASTALADSSLPPAHWANRQLPDAAQEGEAKKLMESLRCVVCQGQSIADSDAEIAGDMRAMVRTRIAAGEKPEAIRAWMVERYGEWVSYQPEMGWRTALLWIAPLLILLAGLALARRRFRKEDSQ